MQQNTVVLTIGSLKASYLTSTEEFLKDAKSELGVVNRSREAADKAKSSNIKLGLYMAVMQDYFDFTLAPKKAPEFFVHKGDAMSYVRATLGLTKGQAFPSTAWNNSYVVFMLVCPDAEGRQALSEGDYLALAQSDLDCLRRTMKHLVDTDPKTDIRAHADVLEMVAQCQSRKDGYRKAIKEIEARVTGKGKAEKSEETAVTLDHAAQVLLGHVRTAGDGDPDTARKIAFIVLTVMDTFLHLSGLPESDIEKLSSEYQTHGMPEEIATAINAKADAADAAIEAAKRAAQKPAVTRLVEAAEAEREAVAA